MKGLLQFYVLICSCLCKACVTFINRKAISTVLKGETLPCSVPLQPARVSFDILECGRNRWGLVSFSPRAESFTISHWVSCWSWRPRKILAEDSRQISKHQACRAPCEWLLLISAASSLSLNHLLWASFLESTIIILTSGPSPCLIS